MGGCFGSMIKEILEATNGRSREKGKTNRLNHVNWFLSDLSTTVLVWSILYIPSLFICAVQAPKPA